MQVNFPHCSLASLAGPHLQDKMLRAANLFSFNVERQELKMANCENTLFRIACLKSCGIFYAKSQSRSYEYFLACGE